MLFNDRADCANQVVTLGLSDRVQPLNDPAVIVAGSFERTVGEDTKLVESLLKSFPNNVVCEIGVSTIVNEAEMYRGAYCIRT